MALLSLILLTTTIAIITLLKRLEASKRAPSTVSGKRLPGPKGLPVIGSVHELPDKCSWMKFHEWSEKYGPIYQVNLAGTNHVWIARDKIAHDLLSKRSAIYSDRPYIPALEHDNRTSGQYLPLMSRNEKWQRQRKFAKQIMDKSMRESFYSYPELEAIRLLFELMAEPSQYNHAMESFVARVTSRLAWGTSQPAEELKQRARELLIGVSPTGALGNKLPFIMSLPSWLSQSKAWELRRGRTEKKFFETMQEEVRTEGQPKQSWTRMFLDNSKKWGFASDLEGSYAVGMHGIAGALTIAAPMQSFCLALCHYPQYESILHEEIDRVLGERMPTFADMPNMPVLRAFIRETLRWRPPVPTGIPHALTQDDEYEGYFIPKGSVIHPLEWSISRDPEVFPEPDEWNPMRWLEAEYPTYQEPLSKYPTITQYSQFGYGRRTCQGMGVAEADLFVGLGSVAWLFSVHADDENEDSDTQRSSRGHGPASRRDSNESTASGFTDTDDAELHKATMTSHKNDSAISFGSIKDSEPVTRTTHSTPAFPSSTREDDIDFCTPELPGQWTFQPEIQSQRESEKRQKPKSHEDDPTMQFSTLLIAKPLPFKFQLRVRNQDRASQLAREWVDKKLEGEFEESRVYWKGGTQGDAECGWGETFL